MSMTARFLAMQPSVGFPVQFSSVPTLRVVVVVVSVEVLRGVMASPPHTMTFNLEGVVDDWLQACGICCSWSWQAYDACLGDADAFRALHLVAYYARFLDVGSPYVSGFWPLGS